MKKLYIGNLSRETSEQDLEAAAAEFGQVRSVAIIKDRYSGESRGFGFVEMDNDNEADAAIDGLNGKELQGRSLRVNEARPQEQRGSGGSGGGGGGRGRSGGYGGGGGGRGGGGGGGGGGGAGRGGGGSRGWR
jgi:RNA recognition motif-containing protein